MENKSPIGFLGAGPMANLALNLAGFKKESGWPVVLYSYKQEEIDEFKSRTLDYKTKYDISTTTNLDTLVEKVGPSGVYWVMVQAGKVTDLVLEQLLPKLNKGAIVIEGGNSFYKDTQRRIELFNGKGIFYIGTGVSGGEEGALVGPSIMPGGNFEAYQTVRPIFEHTAAKFNNEPCVSWIGDKGAGHFVKMVHNGIEYADMQLIAEVYDILRHKGMGAEEIGAVFERWNKGKLSSYLIEITADILKQKDNGPDGTNNLVDKILDVAGMKGTGTWTVGSSLDTAQSVVPVPTIAAAVNLRAISSYSKLRTALNELNYIVKGQTHSEVSEGLINDLENGLYLSKIISYSQGIHLIQEAQNNPSNQFGKINIANVAKIWRAGCIIRANLLQNIYDAYMDDENLPHLLLSKRFQEEIHNNYESLNKVAIEGINLNIAIGALSASRDYLMSITSTKLPVNLIQAQRDFFGAHTYERTDAKGTYHVQWSKQGRPEKRLK